MGIKMNVKWKIKINGKDYGSVDEMPAAERAACKKAMGQRANPGQGNSITARCARIVFNGQEYANIDAMPEDVRQMYLSVMKAVETRETAPGDTPGDAPGGGIANAPIRRRIGRLAASSRGPRPIAPESFSTHKLIIGAAIIALLAGLYFLARR